MDPEERKIIQNAPKELLKDKHAEFIKNLEKADLKSLATNVWPAFLHTSAALPPPTILVISHLLTYPNRQARGTLEYFLTEHLRMSGGYWGITAMDLMHRSGEMMPEEVVDWVLACRHDNGEAAQGGAGGHWPLSAPHFSSGQDWEVVDSGGHAPLRKETPASLPSRSVAFSQALVPLPNVLSSQGDSGATWAMIPTSSTRSPPARFSPFSGSWSSSKRSQLSSAGLILPCPHLFCVVVSSLSLNCLLSPRI